METKPYSLQSPEQIAKDYGGNKKKIAEAMQMGILDPTAGTLAAMFIDRMRNAAQTEAAPQQTVAQQVFAPPAPQMPMGMPQGAPQAAPAPAGLAATPQAAAMPAPAGATMSAPSAQAVPGMAEGGMVPPYMAGGGLSSLPLPDDMFDENRNGGFNDGYRGGGLVAFAGGTGPDGIRGTTDDEEEETTTTTTSTFVEGAPASEGDTIEVTGRRPEPPEEVDEPAGPYEYYGNFRDPFRMRESIEELAPQSTQRREQLNTYLERILNPEEQKKRRQEDMWMALGQIGARMATTPGSLLQAASAGIAEALPGVRTAAAARRAEERGAVTELAKNEGLTNSEARDMYRLIREGTNKYGEFNEARLTREKQDELARYQELQANYRTMISGQFQLAGARESAAASRYGSRLGADASAASSRAQSERAFSDYLGSSGGTIAFNRLVANGVSPDTALTTLRNSFFGLTPAPRSSTTPPPPPGAQVDR